MSKSDSKTKATQKSESKTYQAMLSELDEIVRSVGQGQLDLDEIVGKIEHGYQLISIMRERLDQTRSKVEKLRVDFEKTTAPGNVQKRNTTVSETADDSDSDDDDAPF